MRRIVRRIIFIWLVGVNMVWAVPMRIMVEDFKGNGIRHQAINGEVIAEVLMSDIDIIITLSPNNLPISDINTSAITSPLIA